MPLQARTVAGVPVLIASPASTPDTPPIATPVVLWFHGFRADALAHAAELERCAADGFLAVGIDAVGHGARLHTDLDERLARTPGGAFPVMLELAEATVHELPALIDSLALHHGADASRVSAVGISMGAFLLYRAIAYGIPVRAAVALLGSPQWPGPSSAHTSLAAFAKVRLLSITAEYDESVPSGPVTQLHTRLEATQTSHAIHRHHVLRGAGHLTSATEWHEAMTETTSWLQRFG